MDAEQFKQVIARLDRIESLVTATRIDGARRDAELGSMQKRLDKVEGLADGTRITQTKQLGARDLLQVLGLIVSLAVGFTALVRAAPAPASKPTKELRRDRDRPADRARTGD